MMSKTLKNITLVALFSATSVLMFAAIGGKEKKNSKVKSAVSIKSSIGKISLRSGYEFKGNKLVDLNAKKNYVSFNNYNTIQKGNKTVIVASKHILNNQTAKVENTKSATQIDVKLVKIKLN